MKPTREISLFDPTRTISLGEEPSRMKLREISFLGSDAMKNQPIESIERRADMEVTADSFDANS